MYQLDRDIPRQKIARRIEAQEELEQLAQERKDLQAQLAENRTKMQTAIRNGRELWGVTYLARLTGLTRRAIYDVLEK